ncbi:MAG: DNA repair protein RecO [Ferruginibacter sp.]|nr:DNA repair protein RecO [Ferruginibacter sp.]
MTHQTKAIILQTVKYGETSLVVTALTCRFGLQTYLINGVRTQKKGGTKAGMFQPAAVLDMVVYHQDQKNLQRVKEASWAILFHHLFSDVIKNNIALFMIELLHKSIRQPEENTHLFDFTEDALLHLDTAEPAGAANFPLFFSLHLTHFLGFRPQSNPNLTPPFYLDLSEGTFIKEPPPHSHFLDTSMAETISELLKMQHPGELVQLPLNKQVRRTLLHAMEEYYTLHIPGFKKLRTLQVLNEVL